MHKMKMKNKKFQEWSKILSLTPTRTQFYMSLSSWWVIILSSTISSGADCNKALSLLDPKQLQTLWWTQRNIMAQKLQSAAIQTPSLEAHWVSTKFALLFLQLDDPQCQDASMPGQQVMPSSLVAHHIFLLAFCGRLQAMHFFLANYMHNLVNYFLRKYPRTVVLSQLLLQPYQDCRHRILRQLFLCRLLQEALL